MPRSDIDKYFDAICGYDTVKQDLAYLCDIMSDPEPYRALGSRIPRNVLLTGAPGVGKTLMSECLIKASGRKVFSVRLSEDGNILEAITEAFRKAKEEAPSIVFLDDMEKYSAGRFRQSSEEAAIQACIDDTKNDKPKKLSKKERMNNINKFEEEMRNAARELDFERAMELRDIWLEMKSE